MKISFDIDVPPEAAGQEIAMFLGVGSGYVHARGLKFHQIADRAERDEYVASLASSLGILTLSGAGDDKTEVWELDEQRSPEGFVPYHTDNPQFVYPERYVGFWCVRAGETGGANRLLFGSELLSWLQNNKSDPVKMGLAEEILDRDVVFAYEDQTSVGKIYNPGTDTVRLGNYTTNTSDRDLIKRIETTLSETADAPYRSFYMEPGDVLFFSNHQMLHARESYSKRAAQAPRTMLRTRVL